MAFRSRSCLLSGIVVRLSESYVHSHDSESRATLILILGHFHQPDFGDLAAAAWAAALAIGLPN
jgi:hypothetical protein